MTPDNARRFNGRVPKHLEPPTTRQRIAELRERAKLYRRMHERYGDKNMLKAALSYEADIRALETPISIAAE